MKKLCSVLLALALLLALTVPALAEDAPEILYSPNGIAVGDAVFSCDVYRIDGAHFVGLRDLGDALRFDINYDAETNSIQIGAASGQYTGTVITLSAEWSVPDVVAVESPQRCAMDGVFLVGVRGWNIGGRNYFALEDLASYLGFSFEAIAAEPEPEPEPEPEFVIEDGVLTAYNGDGGVVTVPDGVTVIGERVFYKTDVTVVALPDGVVSIGERAFSHCEKLTAVSLPDGLTEIGPAAFSASGALEAVAIPASVASLGKGAFTGTAIPAAVLPEGLTAIPEYLFSQCSRLESVLIPASVTEIGKGAFLQCGALAEVAYGGNMADWRAVSIGEQNEALTAAKITFGVGAEPTRFADVDEDAYYATAVNWAVQLGVTNGTGSNAEGEPLFSPDAIVKRSEAVTFLWRARGMQEPETAENPFEDVPADTWYTDPVLWAVENGIAKGRSAASFAPGESVKRGEMLTFLWRAMGEPGKTEAYEGKQWYSDAEYWAGEIGLTEGLPTAYSREEPCPRSDVVYYLCQAIVLMSLATE